jgi:hypothetical protein
LMLLIKCALAQLNEIWMGKWFEIQFPFKEN